jgi:hypothetical protein
VPPLIKHKYKNNPEIWLKQRGFWFHSRGPRFETRPIYRLFWCFPIHIVPFEYKHGYTLNYTHNASFHWLSNRMFTPIQLWCVGSLVSIATRLLAEVSRTRTPAGKKRFYSETSKPLLRPNQTFAQWAPGTLCSGVKR